MKKTRINMKLITITLALTFAAVLNTPGDTTVAAGNGSVFHFGDWSQPVSLSVKSSGGQATLVSRECVVKIEKPRWLQTTRLQMLYYPAGNEVWIGEPFDAYVIVGQKIWGVTQSGETLIVRPSQAASDAVNGQDVSVTEFLTKFVANPGSIFWTDGSVSTLPLHLVFGCVPLYTQNPASHVDQSLQLTNVTVVSDQVTAGFRGLVNGLDLSLTLNSKQEIVEAFRGGDRLPILCRRFQPPGEIEAWFGLGVRNWPSPQGGQATLGSIRENANTDKTGQSIGVAYANLAVLIATGDLWIGPDMCDRMVIDGRMIGMRIDGSTREVQIFNTTRARLPLTGDTSEAFLQGIRQFEAEFAANQYRWRPDVSISIPALFAADSRFGENCEYVKRIISLQGKNILIGLSSSNPQAYPEITLGPDLSVLSTRVLSVDSPELRIPTRPIDPKQFRLDED
jgi:hypothetical protein